MNKPNPAEIIKHHDYDPSLVDRVATKTSNLSHVFVIEDPNPSWPAHFQTFKSAIEEALGPSSCLEVRHVGSTSIPGLPAKPIIDMDVIVADIQGEDSYRPQLEAIGIEMRNREPSWHQHRLFHARKSEKWLMDGTLHVWGDGCPEVERHAIFREWIMGHEEDRELYIQIKREAMKATKEEGGNMLRYNSKKEKVVREILDRAFRARGLME